MEKLLFFCVVGDAAIDRYPNTTNYISLQDFLYTCQLSHYLPLVSAAEQVDGLFAKADVAVVLKASFGHRVSAGTERLAVRIFCDIHSLNTAKSFFSASLEASNP